MNTLPELVKGHLYVLVLPRPLRRPTLNELTARLALRGEVQVLVAGNRFDAHGIARLLRRQTTAVLPALQRIHLARAFTCYQVASLLSEVAIAQLPTLVTDLLETFYDENVSLAERRTLLAQCLQELHRLSQQAEVLISAIPTGAVSQLDLFEMLLAAADILWTIESPAPRSAQLNLF